MPEAGGLRVVALLEPGVIPGVIPPHIRGATSGRWLPMPADPIHAGQPAGEQRFRPGLAA
jgi:hypothetical protein